MVFFMTIVCALFLVSTVSAAEIADINEVQIDGAYDNWAVIAGDSVTVKIYFTAEQNASDVRLKATLEGEKIDVSARTSSFDIEDGYDYKKTLVLDIPQELKDQVSETATMEIEIWNGDHETEIELDVRVQRPTYDADIKLISVDSDVEAGDVVPVDLAIRNTGYNDLDDLYVTVSIPALGVEREAYFGDLIAVECDEDWDDEDNYGVDISRKCDEDDEDTVRGRVYLSIPYDAKQGVYTVEVQVENNDMSETATKQISIANDFSAGNVIVANAVQSASAGEDAVYDLHIANPSDTLKFYRISAESTSGISASVDSAVVGVPAGSSKIVRVSANAQSEGDYTFNVNVLSGDEVVDTVALTLKADGASASNPIVVLTIILAIVFVVLLIVLIVLLGKKPEKTEDFGESYY